MDIAGAELAARLPAEHDHLPAALGVWEQRLRPFVTRHQRRPCVYGTSSCPPTTSGTRPAADTPVGSALTKTL
ncbi:hypothetical protein ACWEO4_36535 [Streptomyces sp. NPDC004393]